MSSSSDIQEDLHLDCKTVISIMQYFWTQEKNLSKVQIVRALCASETILDIASPQKLARMMSKINVVYGKWENVIFSDECRSELNPNRRFYVRRSIGIRLKAKYIYASVKFPSYIVVWGAIRRDGSQIIVWCDRNVDSREYQRVLSVGVLHISSGCAFQQDGTPAHFDLNSQTIFNMKFKVCSHGVMAIKVLVSA